MVLTLFGKSRAWKYCQLKSLYVMMSWLFSRVSWWIKPCLLHNASCNVTILPWPQRVFTSTDPWTSFSPTTTLFMMASSINRNTVQLWRKTILDQLETHPHYGTDKWMMLSPNYIAVMWKSFPNISTREIRFTSDPGEDGKLHFLDTCIKIEEVGSTRITVYRKPTHTDDALTIDW